MMPMYNQKRISMSRRSSNFEDEILSTLYLHRYCRDFSIIDDEAGCQFGFFKDGQPCGKYQKFDIEGNCLQEGIKEGNETKKDIKIQNYLTRTVKQGVKANYYKGVGG